jgi:hypothetical protein
MRTENWRSLAGGLLVLVGCVAGCGSLITERSLDGSWVLDSEATEQYLTANSPGVLDTSFGWNVVAACNLVLSFGSDWAYLGDYSVARQTRLELQPRRGDKLEYVGEAKDRRPRTLVVARVDLNLLVEIKAGMTPFLYKRLEVPAAALNTKELRMTECFVPFQRIYDRFKER